MTFSAHGEHLLSSGLNQNIQVWRVQDGQRVAAIETKNVLCVAASKNGKWVAGGTLLGEVFLWDAETYERVWKGRNKIRAVDFSPDSTQLVAGSWNGTATMLDVANGKKIWTIKRHDKQGLITAKFSSDGDRIATAAWNGSVQVCNSKDGQLLVDIPVTVTPWYNYGLRWFNNHIFVVSDNTIKQQDASTGSTVSEWPVPNSDFHSCIAIPRHGKFIVYSTSRSVTVWDTSTHLQIGLVEHSGDIRSIALSPGDTSLAIGGEHGAITIKKSISPHCEYTISMTHSVSDTPLVFQTGFIVNICSTPHFTGTWHSDQSRCTRCLEARSTRRRRHIIDHRYTRVSKSKQQFTCCSSSRTGSFATLG